MGQHCYAAIWPTAVEPPGLARDLILYNAVFELLDFTYSLLLQEGWDSILHHCLIGSMGAISLYTNKFTKLYLSGIVIQWLNIGFRMYSVFKWLQMPTVQMVGLVYSW